MNTDIFAPLSVDMQPNKHWFEVWSIEQDGSLKNCVNFYDLALQSAAAWASQCYAHESARTEEPHIVVHAMRDESNEMVRHIIPEPVGDAKLYTVLNKYRAALKTIN